MLLPAIKKLCTRMRADILAMTSLAGSGHPTSSLSAVELAAILYFKYLRFDANNPKASMNDRVIFSKGHASALLYAIFHVAGRISDKELLTYRHLGSPLEGHPTPRFLYADIATGSLGQGLAVGLGEALALQKIYRASHALHEDTIPHVFVLMGDGELSEGSVWEAIMAAGYHRTQNLTALVDLNRLEQSGETMEGWDTDTYRRRFEAFGWAAIVVDGHDVKALDVAYQKALDYRQGPTVIIAKTIKGKGVSFFENAYGWHGKVLRDGELQRAIEELGYIDTTFEGIIKPPSGTLFVQGNAKRTKASSFTYAGSHTQVKKTSKLTTREGFGKSLVRLAVRDPRIVVLDGDLESSTYTKLVHEAVPQQFFQCHIAEQLMVGVAAGTAIEGLYPVISSYASFLTRAVDQFRMNALSGISMLVNGSHGGVATGADGPSQMGLEDIAIFRSLPGSIVVSPADAIAAEKLTATICGHAGISYIRTTRPFLPLIYDEKTVFPLGGSHVFLETRKAPQTVVLIATGVTVHEALKAQNILEKLSVAVRVIDCYSIKPLDEKTLLQAFHDATRVIVVEDHYPEGGLGEAVLRSVSSGKKQPIFKHLAVRKPPMSGSMEELLHYEEIDVDAIVHTALG